MCIRDRIMGDTYKEEITVINRWETRHDIYRLVNKGAGPDELQILDCGKWRPESSCYIHGVLCHRISSLANTEA